MKKIWLLALTLLCALWSHAGEAPALSDNPAIEARLQHISEELRCLVCQNESLAGSRADLAIDLRREIRTLITDGKTDDEVMEFMVSRYGDFVRYRPPVNPVTWLLWFGPAFLFVLALFILVRMVRRSHTDAPLRPLDPEQRDKVNALLKDQPPHL